MSMLSRLATLGAGVRPLPTFVSSSTNQVASGTSLTVTAPSGIQNGDLIIALTFSTSLTAVLTPPSGFSQTFNDVTSSPAITLNTKIAASESGNYTFTSSASASFRVLMLVYRNATSVNTVGAITRATTSAVSAGAITPTYRGVLLAAFSLTSGTTPTITTPPSGMTSRISGLGATPHAAAYELSPQEVSSTESKSITWSLSSVPVTAQLFQITNEPDIAPTFINSSTVSQQDGTSLSLTVPSGVQAGDLMVAMLAADANSLGGVSWTSPSGWTEVGDSPGSNGVAVALSYKVATGSEPASYAFTTSTTAYLAGSMLVFRNAAFDVLGTFSNTATLSAISPSLSQSLLLACGHTGQGGGIAIGTPVTMTDQVVNVAATAQSYKVSTQKVARGPTGTRTMSSSIKSVLLSIKPTRSLT